MWRPMSSAPLHMHSLHSRDKRTQSKPDISDASPTSPSSLTPPLLDKPTVADELLAPAVNRPPSPERIRQISRQMRGSMLKGNHHHQQSSSGSSSLRSFTSVDRSSWEHTLETNPPSPRSSSRSTISSMASRERPRSVQFLGKVIFNRRSKHRRYSKSSWGASLYSRDAEAPTSNPAKDYFIPVILRRRRATTMKESTTQQKRMQISGPYNFQHLTHARGDAGSLDPAQINHQISSSSIETVNASREGNLTTANPRTRTSISRPMVPNWQTLTQMRLMKRSKSQERVRFAPPRPPRSPPPEPVITPPEPPPRVSSIATTQDREFDPVGKTSPEKLPPGSAFKQPKPFSPPFEHPVTDALMTPRGFSTGVHEAGGSFDPRFSHAITTPDDSVWPLTSSGTLNFENTLPEVPEEEENHVTSPSRTTSDGSAPSSLRGSQSVPALRSTTRRQSNASETLGRFDTLAAKTKWRATQDEQVEVWLPHENWEDTIDYCYDHEAEADFDYQWERPSLEMPPDVAEGEENGFHQEASPSLTDRSRFDVPELSPTSHFSNADRDGALTPTPLPLRSITRRAHEHSDKSGRLTHIRTRSDASSFKESHGFNLSPSLLIPNDYHEQLLMARTEHNFDSEDELCLMKLETEDNSDSEDESLLMKLKTENNSDSEDESSLMNPETEPIDAAQDDTHLDAKALQAQVRVSSISSTESESSSPSEGSSAADRHTSATSTSTAYSRLTDDLAQPKDDGPIPTELPPLETLDSASNVEAAIPPSREHSSNRSTSLNIAESRQPESQQDTEMSRNLRPRSNTTSCLNGGHSYGLFPSRRAQSKRM